MKISDPRFPDNAGRLANLPALIKELETTFKQRSTTEWVEHLLKAGVPAGPIHDYGEALESEHIRERSMVMEMQHPVEGKIRALGYPVKLDDKQQRLRYPPPLLGQHNDEIRAELGLKPTASQPVPASQS